MKSKFRELLFPFFLFILLFSYSASAEEFEETKQYFTVNNATLQLSSDYSIFPIEETRIPPLIEQTQALVPQQKNPGSLTLMISYAVPIEPAHKDNIRFRYDFRSDDIAGAYAASWQKKFQNTYQLRSYWQPYGVKKINNEEVLVLKGQIFSQTGEPSTYHEHYFWANTAKSEVYALTIIYQEKTKENQKEIKQLVKSFQFEK